MALDTRRRDHSRRIPWQTLLAGALIVIVAFLRLIGVFELVDLRALDFAFYVRGERRPQAPIVILKIDSESFQESGYEWPWPRSYMAQIVNAVAAQKPAAIVLDVFYYDPGDPEGDQVFAEAIRKAGNVILANDIYTELTPGFQREQLRLPIPALASSAAALGLANVERDSDGFVRRLLIFQNYQGEVHYSWAAQAVAMYLGQSLPAAPRLDGFDLGDRHIPLDRQHLLVNFAGPQLRTFPESQSAYHAVLGELPMSLTGKIVLIGAYDESLHDTYPTPFEGARSPMPGVEINANAIDTMLSGRFLYRTPVWLDALLALLFGVAGLALSRVKRVTAGLGAAIGVVVLILVIWFGSFIAFGLEVKMAAALIALSLGYLVPTVERAISEERERRRIKTTFERFVPPQVIDDLLEHEGQGALRGQRTELTVLFSDIRGFTTLSEKLSPEEVVNILNEYLGAMTDIIFQNGGTVDKYEGDAILAFWGAPFAHPDDPERGVRTAVEMREALDRLREKWGRPGFNIGIGLHTGEAFVGTIGSVKRLNYTCIGDTVNLSSRIQDLTKDLKAPVLISDATYERVKGEFVAEYRDSRTVKGRSQPVGLYEVLGRRGELSQTGEAAETVGQETSR